MTDNPLPLRRSRPPHRGDWTGSCLPASRISTATHVKGFDEFSSTTFHTGADAFIAAAASEGLEVEQMYAHRAGSFPAPSRRCRRTTSSISPTSVPTAFVLPPEVFLDGRRADNPLLALAEWTRGGGALMMAGGISASRASRPGPTSPGPPSRSTAGDDARVRRPSRSAPGRLRRRHWSRRTRPPAGARWSIPLRPCSATTWSGRGEEATVVATVGGDVLVATREVGRGRSLVWTSDIGPHWCPEDFLAWDGFAPLVGGMLRWLAAR